MDSLDRIDHSLSSSSMTHVLVKFPNAAFSFRCFDEDPTQRAEPLDTFPNDPYNSTRRPDTLFLRPIFPEAFLFLAIDFRLQQSGWDWTIQSRSQDLFRDSSIQYPGWLARSP